MNTVAILAGPLQAALAPSLLPAAWGSETPIELNAPKSDRIDFGARNAKDLEVFCASERERSEDLILSTFAVLDNYGKQAWFACMAKVRAEKQAQKVARAAVIKAAKKLTAEKFAAVKLKMQQWAAAKRQAWAAAAERLRARITGPVGFCQKRVTRVLPGFAESARQVRDLQCLAGQILVDIRQQSQALDMAA